MQSERTKALTCDGTKNDNDLKHVEINGIEELRNYFHNLRRNPQALLPDSIDIRLGGENKVIDILTESITDLLSNLFQHLKDIFSSNENNQFLQELSISFENYLIEETIMYTLSNILDNSFIKQLSLCLASTTAITRTIPIEQSWELIWLEKLKNASHLEAFNFVVFDESHINHWPNFINAFAEVLNSNTQLHAVTLDTTGVIIGKELLNTLFAVLGNDLTHLQRLTLKLCNSGFSTSNIQTLVNALPRGKLPQHLSIIFGDEGGGEDTIELADIKILVNTIRTINNTGKLISLAFNDENFNASQDNECVQFLTEAAVQSYSLSINIYGLVINILTPLTLRLCNERNELIYKYPGFTSLIIKCFQDKIAPEDERNSFQRKVLPLSQLSLFKVAKCAGAELMKPNNDMMKFMLLLADRFHDGLDQNINRFKNLFHDLAEKLNWPLETLPHYGLEIIDANDKEENTAKRLKI